MRLDGVLSEKLSIYLLGGVVMAMDRLKPGTKDTYKRLTGKVQKGN